jgi:multidrug transporter EmrE-like cation transporter
MKKLSLTVKWESHISLYWVAPLLLVLPVLIFWRSDLFYFADDWTRLLIMSHQNFWIYVVERDAEQWFPVFHLVFYAMIQGTKGQYGSLVLINCLGTGINALLLYLWCRPHLGPLWALVLGLAFAGTSVHTGTIWLAYNICYILCLGFFLAALLLTEGYVRTPSWSKLLGIVLCSILAIHSHSFVILGLLVIPLYALLLREPGSPARLLPLALTVALIYLLFALGYFLFLGLTSAQSQNPSIFSGLPGFSYLVFWCYGAFISPMVHLFFIRHLQVWSFGASIVVWGLCLAIIFGAGDFREKRLSLFAIAFNVIPMALVALARHQMPLDFATTPRYAVFTTIGVLLILAITCRILARRLPASPWVQVGLPLGFLALLAGQQCWQIARDAPKYRLFSQQARNCFQELLAAPAEQFSQDEWAEQPFCPQIRTSMNRRQALSAARYLQALSPDR